jgi:predicted permease
MREWVFIFLYGACTLLAVFLAGFWTRFARRRRLRIGNRAARSDRYYILAAAIALNALGMALLTGSRLIANIHYGLSRALYGFEGVGVAMGLATILLSKVALVWVADLEKEPAVWTWTRWMAGVTIAWGILAVFISSGLPVQDFRPAK